MLEFSCERLRTQKPDAKRKRDSAQPQDAKRKRDSAQPQDAKRKRDSAQPQDAKRKRDSAQPQEMSAVVNSGIVSNFLGFRNCSLSLNFLPPIRGIVCTGWPLPFCLPH